MCPASTPHNVIDVQTLRRLLRYEPLSGKLHWLARMPDLFSPGYHSAETQCARWNQRFAGKAAFTCRRPDGYRHTSIFGRTYSAHRVIWALVTGEWPRDAVDHINGDRSDNRFANLRAASRADNARNSAHHNPTGAMGVYRYRDGSRWYASIFVGGRSQHLGIFDSFEAATAARLTAQREHGFHPNHGRKQEMRNGTDG